MVALLLGAAAQPAAATTVKSRYEPVADDPATAAFVESGKLTVQVTDNSQKFDDLEIQVNRDDTVADFMVAPSPPWTVDSIISRSGKKLLRLVRDSSITSDETITVIHSGRRRGRVGSMSLTLDGDVLLSANRTSLLSAAAGSQRSDHGDRPAATLLEPYFEVDADDPSGITTLVSLSNTSQDPVIVRSMLWTDWGVPTLTHYLALSAGDVVSLNLRDVLNLKLPSTERALEEFDEVPLGCEAAVQDLPAPLQQGIEQLIADHTGEENPDTGDCAGSSQGDGIARGYLVFDVVTECRFPSTVATWERPEWRPSPSSAPGGFYGATATATSAEANVLTGDFFFVDFGQSLAVGETLTPAAIPIELTQLELSSQSFYGGFTGHDASLQRIPLNSHYRARYLNGGAFHGGADLLVWRDIGVKGFERTQCGELPSWAPLGEQSVVAWDENENSVVVPGGLAQLCPIAGQSTAFRCPLTGATALPAQFGFLDVDLWHGDGTPAQGWIMPILEASDRFSVGNSATALDDMCGTPAPEMPEPPTGFRIPACFVTSCDCTGPPINVSCSRCAMLVEEGDYVSWKEDITSEECRVLSGPCPGPVGCP